MNFSRCFLICSCIILIFAGINYTLGPMINSAKYGDYALQFYGPYINCEKISDKIDSNPNYTPEQYDALSYSLRHCRYKSSLYTMEHVSFFFNGFIGFICLLVGIFNYQDKSIPRSNLIGMACGIIGIILTLAYIIIGGILYIQYYPDNEVYKRDSDGSVAQSEGGRGFKCYYYSSKGDKTSFYAKYIDFMKSQYNYNKKLKESYETVGVENCKVTSNSLYLQECSESPYITVTGEKANCNKLYLRTTDYLYDHTTRYDMSAKFFTVLFFSILMIPCYIALVFFSFGLSKGSSDYKSI